jgi:transcriptional regulator GlxA family with amidase domain
MSRPLHVDDLASLARLSTSHFSSAFRRSTGESPFRYLRRRRIDHAKQMMLLTNLSLAEISVDCVFCRSSTSHQTFPAQGGCQSRRVATTAAYRVALRYFSGATG